MNDHSNRVQVFGKLKLLRASNDACKGTIEMAVPQHEKHHQPYYMGFKVDVDAARRLQVGAQVKVTGRLCATREPESDIPYFVEAEQVEAIPADARPAPLTAELTGVITGQVQGIDAKQTRREGVKFEVSVDDSNVTVPVYIWCPVIVAEAGDALSAEEQDKVSAWQHDCRNLKSGSRVAIRGNLRFDWVINRSLYDWLPYDEYTRRVREGSLKPAWKIQLAVFSNYVRRLTDAPADD